MIRSTNTNRGIKPQRTVREILLMKRLLLSAAALSLVATAALAALPTGAKAPDFKTTAALAGKDHPFDLAKTRKKGPVVLYFFPAAFTAGCTAEAHEFAEATPDFNKLGATVIGMTGAARVDGKMALATPPRSKASSASRRKSAGTSSPSPWPRRKPSRATTSPTPPTRP
jgi:hypothetical protein